MTKENVLALYRFSLLLKGGEAAARRILLEMLSENAPRLAQLRNERSRLAFALKKLRGLCLSNGGSGAGEKEGETAAPGFAERFSALPEPGRSALALLYLKVLSADDAATLLDLNPDDFSAALRKARALLREPLADLSDLPSQS